MKIDLPLWALITQLLSPLITNVSCVIFRDDFHICEKMCTDIFKYVYIFTYIIFSIFTNDSIHLFTYKNYILIYLEIITFQYIYI